MNIHFYLEWSIIPFKWSKSSSDSSQLLPTPIGNLLRPLPLVMDAIWTWSISVCNGFISINILIIKHLIRTLPLLNIFKHSAKRKSFPQLLSLLQKFHPIFLAKFFLEHTIAIKVPKTITFACATVNYLLFITI